LSVRRTFSGDDLVRYFGDLQQAGDFIWCTSCCESAPAARLLDEDIWDATQEFKAELHGSPAAPLPLLRRPITTSRVESTGIGTSQTLRQMLCVSTTPPAFEPRQRTILYPAGLFRSQSLGINNHGAQLRQLAPFFNLHIRTLVMIQ
jgi:hypothetical protein